MGGWFHQKGMPHDKAEVAHWGLGSLPAPHCTATHESEGSALSLAGLRDLPESRNVLSLHEGGGLSGLPKAAFGSLSGSVRASAAIRGLSLSEQQHLATHSDTFRTYCLRIPCELYWNSERTPVRDSLRLPYGFCADSLGMRKSSKGWNVYTRSLE